MEPMTTTAIVLIAIIGITATCVMRIVIREAHVGLLYRNGRFVQELAPGRHFVWRAGASCEGCTAVESSIERTRKACRPRSRSTTSQTTLAPS